MALHADTVDRNAGSLHPLDELEDALALARLGIIVVVVEQQGVRVSLVGILECLVDELLTGDLEHRRLAHRGLAVTDRAVLDRFIHDIPCIDDVLVAVDDSLDVVLHVGVELLLGKEVALVVHIHPASYLAVPH